MSSAILAWMLLLGAPVVGACLHLAIKDRLSTRSRLAFMGLLAAVVGLAILAVAFGVRFVSLTANIATLAAVYAAYVALALSLSSRIRSPIAGRLILAVTLIPVVFGYFLGTVGALGLLFTVGEFENQTSITRLAPGVLCTRTDGGGPSGGYTLRVHREWPLAPFLHREVKTLGFRREGEGPASCDALRGRPF
ncbi:hypothetical protein CA606_08405 [Caulobacter vibrioides]|uniref:Uncharacterized protein n=1 Tax=Caulobacter vibrioides TaxID=155892 RepID=A0A290MRB2_CAUVI|nr:hypothetical protein [Caulobacter vibrioides]ATC32371.1 hypothetical protein CA606_08405 [Caulobacter vibrioides]